MTATISGDGTSTLINLTTSGNTVLGDASTDTLNVGNGGLVKDASGNVGIGTSSPSSFTAENESKLTVGTGSGNGGITVYTGSTSQGGIFFADGTSGAATYSGILRYNHSDNAMLFYTNGLNERARIDSSGNVGIGTSSPASKLHVYGVGPQLRLSGSGYVVNPTEFVLGQYDSLTGYVQVPGSGKFDVWNNSTGVIARFNNNGNVSVSGALSKGSGSFRISHPLPELAETHDLVHSFIEGPQADNIYRGKVALVNGAASVNIDMASGMTEGTFVLLNREVQCFTTNETGWVHVRGSVTGNLLTIEAQDNTCTDTISWMVIGERKDKHMYDTDWTDENGKVIVEPIKQVERSPAEEAEQE